MPRTLAFFDGTTSAGVRGELWATDGTVTATGLVADIVPGVQGSDPGTFAPAGAGAVAFSALDRTYPASNGPQLFVSDGTADGTAELDGSFVASTVYYGERVSGTIGTPSGFTPIGGGRTLFFAANKTNAQQLWVTDSTQAGTQLVADFSASTAPTVSAITAVGKNRAVFSVSSSASPALTGLWGTDGTASGTVRLSPTPSTAYGLGDGRALTTVLNGTGALLGVTDGTPGGTVTLRSLASGPFNVTPIGGGRALFGAAGDAASQGNGLWVTDGTAAGTTLLVQGPPLSATNGIGLFPEDFASVGQGRYVFAANDGNSISALWVTDGTRTGTSLLRDFAPTAAVGSSSFRSIVSLGNGLALIKIGTSNEVSRLFVTDGTVAGTVLVQEFAAGTTWPADSYVTSYVPAGFALLPGGRAVFAVYKGDTAFQLWTTDGTAAGTAPYAEVPRASGYLIPTFTALPDGRVVFPVSLGNGYEAVWATGGTAASTGQVANALLGGNTGATGYIQGTATFGVATVADLNPLFDTDFYGSHYTDVAAAGVNAAQHFAGSGWHEGRNPDPVFTTTAYLNFYKDVAAVGSNPLTHYDQFGWHEGRDPSAAFDTTLYLLFNPDVKAAGLDPLAHYLTHGQSEGRGTSAVVDSGKVTNLFDPTFYGLSNPDVTAAGVDLGTHFNTAGVTEGRNPDAYFDVRYYLAQNPDVAASGINPVAHYLNVGWKEGRDPSTHFSTTKYLAAYSDVKAAGVNPLQHFLTSGIIEGRSGFGDRT